MANSLYAFWGIEVCGEWELFALSQSAESGAFEPDNLGLSAGLYWLEEIDSDRWTYLENWDFLTEKAKSLLRPPAIFHMAEIFMDGS